MKQIEKTYTAGELMTMDSESMQAELISIIKAFCAHRTARYGAVIETADTSEFLSDAWIAIASADPETPAVNAIWNALDKIRRQARTINSKFESSDANRADDTSDDESFTLYDMTEDATATQAFDRADIRALGYAVIDDMRKSPKAQLDVQAAYKFIDYLSQGISKYNAGLMAGLKRKTIDRICEKIADQWNQ